MAVDTVEKRGSVVQVQQWYVLTRAVALDSTIDAPDRLSIGRLYRGIAAWTPPQVTLPPSTLMLLGVGI